MISTLNIIEKARYIYASSRDGNQKKLESRVNDFMKWQNLFVRTRRRKSQLTAAAAAMHSVKFDYCQRLRTSYNSHVRDPPYLLNMDETAV